MNVQFQIMRRSETTWDIYRYTRVQSPADTRADLSEVIARIVLDAVRDRYFVERPVWTPKGYEWHRIDKSYLVFQAAYNAVLSPKASS
jgi:hypothetical protein